MRRVSVQTRESVIVSVFRRIAPPGGGEGIACVFHPVFVLRVNGEMSTRKTSRIKAVDGQSIQCLWRKSFGSNFQAFSRLRHMHWDVVNEGHRNKSAALPLTCLKKKTLI